MVEVQSRKEKREGKFLKGLSRPMEPSLVKTMAFSFPAHIPPTITAYEPYLVRFLKS